MARDQEREIEDQIEESTKNQWSVVGNIYYPGASTTEKLPTGYYKLFLTYNGLRFIKQEYTTTGIFPTGSPNAEEILRDFNTFWKSEDRFRKFKVPQRRGILLSGIPGSGKSCIVKLLADVVTKEFHGVVLDASEAVSSIQEGIEEVHELHPDMPIMVVLEDIDHYIGSARAVLLQVMDGVNTIDKVMFIATTNNPEALGEALTNRAGRFDVHYRIMDAQLNTRRTFIKTLIPEDELCDTPVDKWAEDTKGMPFGHIKELVVSVKLFNKDYDQTLNRLRNMSAGQTEQQDNEDDF